MRADPVRSRWGFLVAEAVLVVASILAAFAIDAWWAGRQEAGERRELLTALRADFETTGQTLDEALESAARAAGRTGGYLNAVVDDVPLDRDSLIYLLAGVGQFAFFEPSLAAYEGALSTGAIELVRDPTLLEALTEFELGAQHYEQHLELSGEMYYRGAVHEMRRAMGVFEAPPAGLETDPKDGPPRAEPGAGAGFAGRIVVPSDFDVRSPTITAAAEAMYWVQTNAWDGLDRMKRATDQIIGSLDRILSGDNGSGEGAR